MAGNYKSGNRNAHDNLIGKKKGGRPKGSKNKLNHQAKEDLFWLIKKWGGRKGMAEHYEKPKNSKDQKSEVYAFYFKNIPKETEVKGDVNVSFSWKTDDTGDHGPL